MLIRRIGRKISKLMHGSEDSIKIDVIEIGCEGVA
jgi:hypothetical protein